MSTPTQSTITSQNNASFSAEGSDPHGKTIIKELSRNTSNSKYQVEDDDFFSIIECANIDNAAVAELPDFMANSLTTSHIETKVKSNSVSKKTNKERLEASTRHFARWSHYMTHQAPAEVDDGLMQEEGATEG